MDYTDKLTELYDQAAWAPEDTKIQFDLYQKAVNFIDTHKIKSDLAVEIKCDYISCAESIGYTKLVLPQFASILKQMDDEGMENFNHTYDTLWMYKWMMTFIVSYSSFPKPKVLEMYEDMSRRFLEYSSNKQVIYDYGHMVHHSLGMIKEATKYKEKFLTIENDGILSDCEACMITSIGNRIFEGLNFEEYLTVTDPIIKGKSGCASVPRYSNSRIALSFLFVEGLSKNTKKFAKRDDKDVTIDESCLSLCSFAIIYRVLINDIDKAVNLANRQIKHFFGPVDDVDKMSFSRACLILTKKLIALNREWIDLPELTNIRIPNDSKEVFLHQYFEEQFDNFLNAFDNRNGNTIYSEREKGLYDYFVSYKLPK